MGRESRDLKGASPGVAGGCAVNHVTSMEPGVAGRVSQGARKLHKKKIFKKARLANAPQKAKAG